jgi:hypothetical protein
VNVFPFIEAEKAERRNVVKTCELLAVSRSAFYEWHKHVRSERRLADEALGERIRAIHEESRGVYGWPRVHRALRDGGVHVGREHVARIMRDNGLVGRCRRRSIKTTISDPDVAAVDLLKRSFAPGTELDRVYVGDITYIRTWEGWLYLATVIDLASRRVVGWAIADHMRAELVCDALRMAIENRRPAPGAMFHSDRGTQTGFNRWSQHRLVGWSVGVRRELRRGLPAEGLTWAAVERVRDCSDLVGGPARQVGAFWEILTKQAVGVLVRASLPRALRVGEVDRDSGLDLERGVLGELFAAIPGQRPA